MTDEIFFYLHIPKCGGTSIAQILKQRFGDAYRLFTPADRPGYSEQPTGSIRAISGHFRFGLHTEFQAQPRYVATFREPLARLLSFYRYVRKNQNHHLHQEAVDRDADQFFQYLADIKNREFSNLQCWHLADDGSFASARAIVSDHIWLAAPIEFMDFFAVAIQRHLGLPETRAPQLNTTSNEVEGISPETMQLVYRHNLEDLKLYHFVKERFTEQIIGDDTL